MPFSFPKAPLGLLQFRAAEIPYSWQGCGLLGPALPTRDTGPGKDPVMFMKGLPWSAVCAFVCRFLPLGSRGEEARGSGAGQTACGRGSEAADVSRWSESARAFCGFYVEACGRRCWRAAGLADLTVRAGFPK